MSTRTVRTEHTEDGECRPAFPVHTGPSLSNTVRLIISEHAGQYHLDDPVRRLVAKIIHAVEDAER